MASSRPGRFTISPPNVRRVDLLQPDKAGIRVRYLVFETDGGGQLAPQRAELGVRPAYFSDLTPGQIIAGSHDLPGIGFDQVERAGGFHPGHVAEGQTRSYIADSAYGVELDATDNVFAGGADVEPGPGAALRRYAGVRHKLPLEQSADFHQFDNEL